jgi:hypothetical protein
MPELPRAINADKAAHPFESGVAGERYSLTARGDMTGGDVELNGAKLKMPGDELPAIHGAKIRAGNIDLTGDSITFLTLAGQEIEPAGREVFVAFQLLVALGRDWTQYEQRSNSRAMETISGLIP